MKEAFLNKFSFTLDDFQLEAIDLIDKKHSVVVFAPTGSGKTVIAEFCAAKALTDDQKIFYTTPLKALSNQKFHDFQKEFGADNVGILTGDTSVNRDAQIVVMTTEIFRNMLYGIHEDSSLIDQVGYLVLDECHYMNDPQRGTVWEESIIYCPDHIQMVALSATIANAVELTDWINEVHHDTRLVYSDFRPVPLRFSYYDRDKLYPLFEQSKKGGELRLNKQLKNQRKGNRFARHKRVFQPNNLIETMAEKNMLPAIFFTFSRKEIEKNLKQTRKLRLLNDFERQQLRQQIDDYVLKNPYLEGNPMLEAIANGFACHHAGLLPGIKHLVETLFQQGLIKAVFATETLAAGINMPARSTVITKLSKRVDDGHRMLLPNEFLQMSGRAGRRGMDDKGFVVVVSSPYEGAQEAAELASSPADPLNSQFTPSYGMVLNLLKRNSLKEAEFLIRKSFGQFTVKRRLAPLVESIQKNKQATIDLQKTMENLPFDEQQLAAYEKLKAKYVEASKFKKVLTKQVKRYGPSKEITQQLAEQEKKRERLKEEMAAHPCSEYEPINKIAKRRDRLERLQRELKKMEKRYAREEDVYWQNFHNIYALLNDQQYIDADDTPTERGEFTAKLRAENEFYLAEVIQNGYLSELSADELVGVITAIINDNNNPRQYSLLKPSPNVNQTVRELHKEMKRINKIQNRHHVDVPMVLNPIYSGLMEAWSQGLDWTRLFEATNVAEGDMVRVIRRTADVLRQMSRIHGMPRDLAKTARIALNNIYREPVVEVDEPEPSESADPVESSEIDH